MIKLSIPALQGKQCSRLRVTPVTVLVVAIAVLFVVRLVRSPASQRPGEGPDGLIALAAVCLGFFLINLAGGIPAVIFHELGHVAAGWLVGFRWRAIRLGKVHITRKGRGLHLEWK